MPARVPLVRLEPTWIDQREEDLRLEVRDFLAQERAAGTFEPAIDNWLVGFDPAFTEKLAARGWVGMVIPPEYHGPARTTVARHVVLEELLAAGAPVSAHWVADRQVVPGLLKHGTPEQRERFLPRVAAGRCFFAVGMSEPDAGSDLTAIRTTARRAEGGWRITGTKLWTSGAHHAHVITVLARCPELEGDDGRPRFTQFLVEQPAEGFEIRPIITMDGVHHFNELSMQEVFVPDTMVLGTPGGAWRQILAELANERGGPERYLSVFPLVRAVIDASRDDTGDDTALAESVGSLASRLVVMRRMSLALARAVERGDEGLGGYAAVVKDLGTELEIDAVRILFDRVLDGAGATDSAVRTLLAQATDRIRSFGIRAGSTEMLRNLIAREVGVR